MTSSKYGGFGPSKLVISQRFLPHYRVRFFDQLARALAKEQCRLQLLYSYGAGAVEDGISWAERLRAYRIDLRLAELEESAIFAPGLFYRLIRYAPDLVILEDLGGLPDSLVGSLYCRLWRKPYLIWGLGNVPQKRRSRLRRLLRPLIAFLYRGASGFICYSTHAASVYEASGKPTYLAPNCSVSKPTPAEAERTERQIVNRYRGDCVRLVSIGVLKRQKRFDVLLRALGQLPGNVMLDLIGDGPEMSALRELADGLGIARRIAFHGSLYDGSLCDGPSYDGSLYDRDKKSGLLSRAHLGVLPGRGGLAIQEMMRHGVPVVSGVADGTENDLIKDRENGYLVDGFLSADEIAEKVQDFLALTAEDQTRMGLSALAVIMQTSNLDTMMQGMVRAIKSTLPKIDAQYSPSYRESDHSAID
jgi:glycosyltransferase involved in cell wall biosynthesis